MAIIPFGLIGTLYGHALWDVPLSMFTVVGLLGMTGIIINDSIVLVTTIDEYAQERGLFPSIIDGTADRLRPVMLTTLTTVLGLAPLLYERSSQAQFLKPTVITLVYGLGFGMVLVLLVVPALMAMQHDLMRIWLALRRSLRARRARRLRVLNQIGVVFMLGWLGLTLGYGIWQQALFPALLAFMPSLAELPVMPVALGLFIAGMAVVTLILFAVSAVVYSGRRARSV
jgi:hypothetical protein